MHYLIAKKFLASMNTTGRITNIISVVGISLGSFALILSISVLNGFENKLDEKISNFDGHLRISNSISNDKLSKINLSLKILSFCLSESVSISNYINNCINRHSTLSKSVEIIVNSRRSSWHSIYKNSHYFSS